MARLNKYHKKRNFKRTPEPPAGPLESVTATQGGLFVVHKHAARRLHYDLRLEHNGVLESWAVPKGPSAKPGEKRLAVHVEDHPLAYGDFEGVIPQGEYGGGTVMLWDRGRCIELQRSTDHLKFILMGEKLRGTWSLVRMRSGKKTADNWLLIKRSDLAIQAELKSLPPRLKANVSVATGRTMQQIATNHDGIQVPAEKTHNNKIPSPVSIPGARRKALPREPRPQLATLTQTVPRGKDWIHEIKFDGYRIMARLKDGKVKLISRNGLDWTARFPEIAELLGELPVSTALLDGEIVASAANGISSFRLLQEALTNANTAGLVYQLFDLLYLDGFDLGGVILAERKSLLRRLFETTMIKTKKGNSSLRFTDHFAGTGMEMFDQACSLGLEGIVSKLSSAIYQSGRNKHWLKIKCTRHIELLIGGYTDARGSRTGFGALLLGGRQKGHIVYAGKVGTGFSGQQLKMLLARMRELTTDKTPFKSAPAGRGIHWIRPELVAEVEFSEWTRDGRLRQPSFRGLREDRDPQEIYLPSAESRQVAVLAAGNHKRVTGRGITSVAGVRLSHPERVLYPRSGITKHMLAQYYEEIADWLLPSLMNRPLSLLRCPQGRQKECFFQKHPGQALSGKIPQIQIREKQGRHPFVFVRTLSDMVALVQAGALELHVWGSRVDDVEHPDILVFDLDPAPGVHWKEVRQTAVSLRQRLLSLGLESFVRTTGGKGLHVVVPLVPHCTWQEAKSFSRSVANAHAQDAPRLLTINMAKAKRRGRIFLDYLRNGRGATAIASYSTRARPGAPVAAPVRWDELTPGLASDHYNFGNIRRRLASLRADPWEYFEQARRPLTRKLLNSMGVKAGGK